MDKVPIDIKDAKSRAKDLFKKGQVAISFRVFEDEVVRMTKSVDDKLSQIYILVAIARLKTEIGEFTESDKTLDEV